LSAPTVLQRQRSSASRAPSTTVRSLRELQWSPSPASRGRKKRSDPQCQTANPAMTTQNCIPAMRFASGSSFTFQKSLPRTDGRRLSLLPKEGGGAPNGAPRLPRLVALARPRPDKRAARLSALLRGHAPGFLPTRPGPRFLESPDANGRTLSGTSAASTSRSGTRRTGRCPSRPRAQCIATPARTAPAPPQGVPSRKASFASGILVR